MDNQLANLVVTKLYNYSKEIKYYHWNYVDRDFYPIHPQLDEVYEYLLDSADTIAELARQHMLAVNPWALGEAITSGQSNHDLAINAVVNRLNEVFNDIVQLRTTLDEMDTGTQSALDQVLYDGQVLIWKWTSSL